MITTSRLQVTGVTGGPLRITGASLVNGAYELATAGGADYELQTERQTTMDNILFIPGIANPVSEINSLLFGAGQQGTFIAPSLTPSLISGSTFGTGVETLTDLSPRNNPFSQATPSNRAAWFREPKRGRVNLLVVTEQFDSATWTKLNSASVSSNTIIAPDGTLTADTFVAGANSSALRQTINLAAGSHTTSMWIRRKEGSGDVELSVTGGVWSSVAVTSEWQRFSVTQTVSAGNNFPGVRLATSGDEVYIWGAQVETGSTATAYQRVTTAFDVTEAGQRDCYGVRADGIDDGYATAGNVDFSGTDKVTVFAAVRKLSDATRGMVCELGNLAGPDQGMFMLNAPRNNGADDFNFSARGGTLQEATATSVAAPVTQIVTGIADIGASQTIIRLNGTQAAINTGSLGGGNFGNRPLHALSRITNILSFNGNLYALIVAGGSYPLSTIQRVERILSRITPTVNL